MAEQILKLTPNRDLQAYFLTPSAIAAMSWASASGYTLSGKWRQQFDWAVVEWNRDNVFEHPALRNLPDGDLSGLVLTYQEQRTGCIPFDSNLYPVVAWDQLRLWVPNANGTDTVYYVNLVDHATPITGSYVNASGTMTIVANPGAGQRVGLAFLEEHYYYTVQSSDQLSDIATGLASTISSFSTRFTATSTGASVIVSWVPLDVSSSYPNLRGANGNRLTMYGFAETGAQVWEQPSAAFVGGAFPSVYEVSLDFSNLQGKTDDDPDPTQSVPTSNVRKLRWTWAADLQPGEFAQTEFSVTVSNWSVTGTNRIYSVAGPGSRRIEESDPGVTYSGSWTYDPTGNFSNSRIIKTVTPGSACTIAYSETAPHQLYLGSRRYASGTLAQVVVDDGEPQQIALNLAGEDVLVRVPLGAVAAGTHSVTLTHIGTEGEGVYLDFVEIAYPSNDLPDFPVQPQLALATDWDTYHSQSLPAERTAWLIQKLGFTGRINHYTGALWFYEISRPGTQYASLTVTLNLAPNAGSPYVQFALADSAADLTNTSATTLIQHLVLPDDTSATVAQAVAALINIGTNLVWASASTNQLTVTARSMGTEGNGIGFALHSNTAGFAVTASSNALSGGIDGTPYDLDPTETLNATLVAAADFWRTDLSATPPINRAARDWHQAYYTAIAGYGLEAVAAFSTELGNGDPSSTVGIAQQYPDGTPVVLSTPSIQTNFSTTSLAYWTQVYLAMAGIQQAAGLTPYLQSGEVQWWYFQKTSSSGANIGMPFYDAYTLQQFRAKYGTQMQTILTNEADPSDYPNEMAFLPTLIGTYTAAIRSALQTQYPTCRYEVLYPTDTNDTALNSIVNFPTSDWTPENLNCLKTECFGFTGGHDLVNSTISTSFTASKGFPNPQRSHLVGVGDAWNSWFKEVDIAQSQGLESVVLFALDQYCLIGYAPPPFVKLISSQSQG